MSTADLIAIVFIMGSIFTVINLWLMHSVAKVMLSQMKSQLSEFALYMNSLNNYSQALQDLKDKEMFDSITKSRKGTGGN
jgi:hypothetical protein